MGYQRFFALLGAWGLAPAFSARAFLPPTNCTEVVVGGGWGGVYYAYRRVTSGTVDPATLCLFEKSHRVGGRTYSVNVSLTETEFVLDVGA